MAAASAPHPDERSALLAFIAYRRGERDGDAAADWLNRHLKSREIDSEYGKKKVSTYYDLQAPAIHDWTKKWRGDLATARAMILVCSPGTAIRRPGTDWLYDEVDWWIRNRKTAPILVLAGHDDPSWVPAAIRQRWPNAQRLTWKPADRGDDSVLLARITEGLILSERGINYEEIRRLKIRNRALLILSLVTFILGALSVTVFRLRQVERRIAERNLQISDGASLQVAVTAYKQRDIETARAKLRSIEQPRRAFEWKLVRAMVDQSTITWTMPENVNDLDYSPDGRCLAIARNDGLLSLRCLTERDIDIPADGGRVTSREVVKTTPQGEQLVKTISDPASIFAARFIGNRRVATIGNDGTVHLWDVTDGNGAQLLPYGDSARKTLAVNAERTLLASGNEKGLVHVWAIRDDQFEDPEPRATLNVGWEPVALEFTPDSHHLLIAGDSLYVQPEYSAFTLAWEWTGKTKPRPLETPSSIASFARAGQTVYGARQDGAVVSWDLATGKSQVALNPDPERRSLSRLRAAPDGALALGVSNVVFLWNPAANRIRTMTGAEEEVSSFAFRPGPSPTALAVANKKIVKFYDVEKPGPRVDLGGEEARLMDISSAGGIAVTASGPNPKGSIEVWQLPSGKRRTFAAPTESYSVMVFPDGARFAVGWRDGAIRCYRTSDAAVLWQVKAVDRVDHLVLAPGGQYLISSSEGFQTKSHEVWRADDGSKISTLDGAGPLAISPDARLLATEGYSYLHRNGEPDTPLFRLHEFPSLKLLRSAPARRQPIRFLSFDPQGRNLLLTMKNAELWDPSRAEAPKLTLPLNAKLLTCAGFSPDGSRVYACVSDVTGMDPSRWHGDLLIFNAATGDLMLRIPGDEATNFESIRWLGDRIYFLNRGGISILNASLEGIEDWDETDRREAWWREIEEHRKAAKKR